MGNLRSLLPIKQRIAQEKIAIKKHTPKTVAGFTLIELLVVILIVGVLAAISAPDWIGFLSQRRVNAASDVIFRSLQDAQSQAKNKKLSYSVSFRTPPGEPNGVPEYAVYATRKTDPANSSQTIDVNPATDLPDAAWKSIGEDLAIRPGQVVLGTNLTDPNTASTDPADYNLNPEDDKITFDYTGALPRGASTNLTVVVAAPQGAGANARTKRCVTVTTLLGNLTKGRGQYDQANNPEGCK